MSETFLDRVRAYKLKEIASDKRNKSQNELDAEARMAPAVRPFESALRNASRECYGLIAEVKKASPSRGIIRADFDPVRIAKEYAMGGATCLSVLTDTPYFGGKKEYLAHARSACSLPVLRKDFIYDTYQVSEARALGADCILIIMAALEDSQAAELEAAAFGWGMDVLVEVHNIVELERAARLRSRLIGINNRDLKTLETTLERSRELSRLAPRDCTLVSESGLSTAKQLEDLARHGLRCFLVGESLMKHDNIMAAVQNLLAPPITQNKTAF